MSDASSDASLFLSPINHETKFYTTDNTSIFYLFSIPSELLSHEQLYTTTYIPTHGTRAIEFFNILSTKNKHIVRLVNSIHTYVFDGEMKSYDSRDLMELVDTIARLCPRIQSITLMNFTCVENPETEVKFHLSEQPTKTFNPFLQSFNYKNVEAGIKFHNFIFSSISIQHLKHISLEKITPCDHHLIKRFLEELAAVNFKLSTLQLLNLGSVDNEFVLLLIFYLKVNKKILTLILRDLDMSQVSDRIFLDLQKNMFLHRSLGHSMLICKNEEKRFMRGFENKVICS